MELPATYDERMAQPKFVPVKYADRSVADERMPPAEPWLADRPAEVVAAGQPRGAGLGNPGPDQGFVLKLLRRFEGRIRTQPGEHMSDVLAGCTGVALKRASLFGRAPVILDVEAAFNAWGFLDPQPSDALLRARRRLFNGCRNEYSAQRGVADAVRADALALTPAQISDAVTSDLSSVLDVQAAPASAH